MNIAIISFTLTGGLLNKRLIVELKRSNYLVTGYTIDKYYKELGLNTIGESLNKWVEECFKKFEGIIFIGACGIAVRSIAPFLKGKDKDPAVVVINEIGKYIIPILSGHIGGANDLAIDIASMINGIPVITTATDLNNKFAVDIFAKKKNLFIENIKMIKHISSKILIGEKVSLVSDFEVNNLPSELKISQEGDVGIVISTKLVKPFIYTLNLIPKINYVGIGCRKGKSLEEIEEVVFNILKEENISINSIKNICSIDLKKFEDGIIDFSQKYKIPFHTYSANELKCLEGEFTKSEFVSSVTGVNNVCERAAALGSNNGKLIVKKISKDGITVAIAQEEWSVDFE